MISSKAWPLWSPSFLTGCGGPAERVPARVSDSISENSLQGPHSVHPACDTAHTMARCDVGSVSWRLVHYIDHTFTVVLLICVTSIVQFPNILTGISRLFAWKSLEFLKNHSHWEMTRVIHNLLGGWTFMYRLARKVQYNGRIQIMSQTYHES